MVDTNIVTIKLEENSSVVREDLPSILKSKYDFTIIQESKFGYIDIRINDGTDIFEAYSFIKENIPDCLIEINSYLQFFSTPDDDDYGDQWYLTKSKASTAWDYVTGAPEITIAILDTGCDWEHEDLGIGADNYQNIHLNDAEDDWSNKSNPLSGNGVDDDNNGKEDDYLGWDFYVGDNDPIGTDSHGTRVAGIIGAKTNNGVGIAGVAGGYNSEGCKLLNIRIGEFGVSATTANVDNAIQYAIDQGVNIINMSWGAFEVQSTIDMLEDAYNNHDIVLVAASGRTGSENNVDFPASNEHVIAVGATRSDDYRSLTSDYGSTLELSAPGENIYSTTNNNSYSAADGTSFATPQVAATAALLLSIDPELTNSNIRSLLRASADKVHNGWYDYNWDPSRPGHSKPLGYGRLNVLEAVKSIYPKIIGDDFVCYKNKTYTLANKPSGTTVSWSIIGNKIDTVSTTSTSCVLKAKSTSRAMDTLKVTITYTNINKEIVLKKAIWAGKPATPSISPSGYPTVQMNLNDILRIYVTSAAGASSTSYNWTITGSIYKMSTSSNSCTVEAISTGTGNYYMTSGNVCGRSNSVGGTVNVSSGGGGGWQMMVNPNPSNNQITISITDDSREGNLDDKIVNNGVYYSILNNSGVIVQSGQLYSKTKTLDISKWQKGIYYIVYYVDGIKKSSSFIKN